MPRPLGAPREPLRLDEQRNPVSSNGNETGTITGRRCVVAFDPDHHEIRFDDAPPHVRLTVRVTGRAGKATTTAHGFTREIVIAGTGCVERCFVLHDLPLAVIEWTPLQPAPEALIHLEILVRTGADALWRIGEGAVRIDAAGRTFALLACADARLAVREDLDTIRIVAALPAGARPARIAFAAALMEGDDIDSILDAARNADSRIRARTASLRRRDRESIRLRSSDPGADAALRNAVLRIDAIPASLASDPAGRDNRQVRRQGRAASPRIREPGPRWIGLLDRIGPTGRLALAALAAGEPTMAIDILRRLADPDGLLALVCYAWTGDRAVLPHGTADAQPPDPADDPPPARLAARRIVAIDPWLSDSAAAPILGLALDLLGAAPDATRGRLRLRPVLPDGWQFMEVTDLPMGDARIRLLMARSADTVHLEIEQTHGAVPVRAILEPIADARALVGATVDGQPASLVPRPLGDRIRIPVQLALDHARRLRLDLA